MPPGQFDRRTPNSKRIPVCIYCGNPIWTVTRHNSTKVCKNRACKRLHERKLDADARERARNAKQNPA